MNHDRRALRLQYLNAWKKYQSNQALNALERVIVDVILAHPEYHNTLQTLEKNPEMEFFAEAGVANPFLHMGLHLSIREQVATNRPFGIQAIYQTLSQKNDAHDCEHLMIEILAQTLWQAERDGKLPDEQAYLKALQALSTGSS